MVFALSPLWDLQGQWTKSILFDDSDMALDLSEARSFQKYPTYQQYLDIMEAFASDHPDICRLDTIGYSTEGRLLLALKISDQVQEDEAEASFFYTSTMHGNEIVGYVLLLRLADHLLNAYGKDTEISRLVENLQIWINPLANPDGSFSAGNNLTLQYAVRGNASGVDLNRDFPVAIRGEADDGKGRAVETELWKPGT
jgi:murein tripeptide amidase MpaA